MADILVGTCGYSYKEWIGPVYPEGAKKDQFLALYAGMFGTVELDYTYYSMPKSPNIRRMTEEAPSLTFAVKAHQSLTHRIDPFKWQDEAKTYIQAVEPLREAGCLEAVLFQFPFSFHYEADNRRYLDRLLSEFSGINSAVEFRNNEWGNNRVFDEFRKRNTAYVSTDMPDLKGLPPVLDVCTSAFSYFRLHGRNTGAWWGSDAAARYDYLYNGEELEAAVQRIKQIVIKADRLIVYFNNHRRGQAVKNAETLKKLLMNNE
ncbi:MAG: DUF72 domain-containing protein [Treponema sp.]|nr:DUF72 domain-containing protein [Treponema sp.]MCL2271447.1 DUF72 domain-containing protein [Treponema sp.]